MELSIVFIAGFLQPSRKATAWQATSLGITKRAFAVERWTFPLYRLAEHVDTPIADPDHADRDRFTAR